MSVRIEQQQEAAQRVRNCCQKGSYIEIAFSFAWTDSVVLKPSEGVHEQASVWTYVKRIDIDGLNNMTDLTDVP